MLTVSTKATEFADIEPGVYHGVCIWVVDLGMQPGFNQGTFAPSIFVNFEIEVQGKRESIGAFYTVSFGAKANLGKMLRGWFGKLPDEMDLHKLIKKPCMVHVTHKEDTGKPIITSVMPGAGIPPTMEEYTEADSLALPDFFQEKIREGLANTAIPAAPAPAPSSPDDVIPF
jgi:hypothetical protein